MSPTREELDRRHKRLARALEVGTPERDDDLPKKVLDAIDRLPDPLELESKRRNDDISDSGDKKKKDSAKTGGSTNQS